jgi:hypothetical protein
MTIGSGVEKAAILIAAATATLDGKLGVSYSVSFPRFLESSGSVSPSPVSFSQRQIKTVSFLVSFAGLTLL